MRMYLKNCFQRGSCKSCQACSISTVKTDRVDRSRLIPGREEEVAAVVVVVEAVYDPFGFNTNDGGGVVAVVVGIVVVS